MESVDADQSYSGNVSAPLIPVAGLVPYYLFLLIIIIPVIFFNVLILLALLVDRTTVGIIRLVLCNIPAACLVVALVLLVFNIAGVVVAFTEIETPDRIIHICRMCTFFVNVGGAARFLFLAAFSVTVYYIMRLHMPADRESNQRVFIGFIVAITVLWTVAILSGLPVLFDAVITTSCRYTVLGGSIKVALFVLIFAIGGFTTSITFLFFTAFYIRRHIISDPDVLFKKALLKLGFFLLIGNVVSFFGQIVPIMVGVGLNNEQPTLAIAVVANVSLSLVDLSLIPTPILLTIYFNPVRTHLKKWLCCCCGRRDTAGSMRRVPHRFTDIQIHSPKNTVANFMK